MLYNNSISQTDLLELFEKQINQYTYDQFYLYPSKNKNGWQRLLIKRLTEYFENNNIAVFSDIANKFPLFIITDISKWDENHFGFKMAKISLIAPAIEKNNSSVYKKLIEELISFLKANEVKFVSVRINGDNLFAIRNFEDANFHYIEDVIWPVMDCRNFNEKSSIVREMKSSELEQVKIIANKYQYQRGHFHCDEKFAIKKVNEMYGKWVESAFKRKDIITVIEFEGKVKGYFVCGIDEILSEVTGFKYGRLKSLTIDPAIRGKGLGKKLFEGTIHMLKKYGAEYIDSGYSTKNHLSAKLHTIFKFNSVYEEITLHNWVNKIIN